jgi:serine/threonine protein phosphatase 1
MRLYAIGDVHGMDALLAEAHRAIARDLESRPAGDHRIVHVGDYVDRGPDSAVVIERLARLSADDARVVCLRGNHDALLLAMLADSAGNGTMFLENGGDATLRSYGVFRRPGEALAGLSASLAAALPAHHRAFLEKLRFSVQFGDYFFCHAGVRPGIPLSSQDPDELIWLREGFLDDDSDLGAVVIHGHTPVPTPTIRPNRIDIDTGAVFGGRLTVIALEGSSYRFL